jgi:TRAP-type C4-dicarboxylate transport system substrate-binding protein
MRFYEVAPNLIMTQHAITIRPLCFSSQTMARLPAPLQEAIKRAGKEAGVFGRQAESSEDGQKVEALERAGRLRRVEFTERAALKRAVDPVMVAYAREVDAEQIFARINAITS